jgi:hypothetical protein
MVDNIYGTYYTKKVSLYYVNLSDGKKVWKCPHCGEKFVRIHVNELGIVKSNHMRKHMNMSNSNVKTIKNIDDKIIHENEPVIDRVTVHPMFNKLVGGTDEDKIRREIINHLKTNGLGHLIKIKQ